MLELPFSHEHFRAIHSPPGGHHAADRRGRARGDGRLFATARCPSAASGFSNDHRRGRFAGSEP